MKKVEIPKYSLWLFEQFCSSELHEELQGDLEEAFDENVQLLGASKARWIYRKEVLRMIRPSVIKQLNLMPLNLLRLPRNYLKTSIRAFKLNPFYVSANIMGLALALSICTIGYFNYHYNASFNKHYAKANNLYKIHGLREATSTVGLSASPLTSQLKTAGIPTSQYIGKNLPIRLDKKLFNEQVAFTNDMFFEHFETTSLGGGKLKATRGNEIAISESTALKLFNEIYPIGKVITMVFPNKEEKSFIISDVFEQPPHNSSFVYSVIISIDHYFDTYDRKEMEWSNWVDGTFVFLENHEKDRIESLLDGFVETQNASNPELYISRFKLENVVSWPAVESTLYGSRFRQHLHASSVLGIAGSAIAILLLACFNFINTSIALSGKRLKEIAIRKVLGGNRKRTIVQFMIENTLMITVSVVLSFGISYLLIPSYNAMFSAELIQMERVPVATILQFSLFLVLVVTFLSAAYPALYISKFTPLVIFKNNVVLSGKNRLMMILLTFQFALCFYNLFGIFLLVDNAHYQEKLDRGYEVDQVVNVPLNRPEQFEELRNQLLQNPIVNSVAGTQSLIGFRSDSKFINYEGIDIPVSVLSVGVYYAESLGLRLSKGSFFTATSAQKQSNLVVINRMLQDELGVDILNQPISMNGNNYIVTGIVDDFTIRSIVGRNKIKPTLLKIAQPDEYLYAAIQVNGSPEKANEVIEQIWYETFPQELYTGFLQNSVLQNIKKLNFIMVKINVFLGLISILISVLGLYTLISLTVQRRSKEFGVRKVLGASRNVIIHLLGKELYWMLAISSIIGLAASTVILSSVFDIIYAYHISPNITHFVKAILSVLGIIVLAVGYKAFQTGRMNPVDQLRAE